MKKLVLVCAFVIGVSAISFAQGGGRRTPAERTDMLKTQLTGLTDDQASKITAIYTVAAKSQDSLRTASNGDFQAMMPGYMKLNEATTVKIKAVLTADQAAAYQKIVDEQAARMKARMQGN
jgi:protein CpxP